MAADQGGYFADHYFFDTVESIQNALVAGNGYGDLSLWLALDEVILDESRPMELRYAASLKVDDIVGKDDEFFPVNMTREKRVERHCLVLRQCQ